MSGCAPDAAEIAQWLEATTAGNQWNADAAREAGTGRQFWVFVPTVQLTVITATSLVFGWRSQRLIRCWWMGAAVVALIDRLFTFTFLIPSMLVLMNDTALDPKHAAALALSWARLDWLQLGAVAYRAVARNVGLDATWG